LRCVLLALSFGDCLSIAMCFNRATFKVVINLVRHQYCQRHWARIPEWIRLALGARIPSQVLLLNTDASRAFQTSSGCPLLESVSGPHYLAVSEDAWSVIFKIKVHILPRSENELALRYAQQNLWGFMRSTFQSELHADYWEGRAIEVLFLSIVRFFVDFLFDEHFLIFYASIFFFF